MGDVTEAITRFVLQSEILSEMGIFRQLLGLFILSPDDFHQTRFTSPSPLNFIPCLTAIRTEKGNECFAPKRLPRCLSLDSFQESNGDKATQMFVSIDEPMFHQIESVLQAFSVAAWVEVLHDEMNKLGNVVVVSCGFAFPRFEVLFPPRAKGRKLRNQSRHDFRFG